MTMAEINTDNFVKNRRDVSSAPSSDFRAHPSDFGTFVLAMTVVSVFPHL